MPRHSPDSTSGRSPDSPDRDVHLTGRTGSRDPRRHRFDAVVSAFVAACRAEVLSERTIEFYLEALNSYRAFAGADEHDLTLADVDLGVGRAWLADFVERRRKPATVAAQARAMRVFSHWIVTDDYIRTDPLEELKVPTIPNTIVETFTTDQMTDLLAERRPDWQPMHPRNGRLVQRHGVAADRGSTTSPRPTPAWIRSSTSAYASLAVRPNRARESPIQWLRST